MIEAVSTVIQNTQFSRGSAEQVSPVDAFAANPERVQRVATSGPVSPRVHVDVNFDTAVLQFLNGDRDVVRQIPSESRLEAQARDAARQAEAETQASPRRQSESAQASVQQASSNTGADTSSDGGGAQPQQQAASINAQQAAAFQAAAQSGNSNAGSVTLLA